MCPLGMRFALCDQWRARVCAQANDGRSLAQRLASPHHHQSPASHRKMGTRARYPSVEVEDGDSMPDSAPERPDVHAKLPGLVHEAAAKSETRLDCWPSHSEGSQRLASLERHGPLLHHAHF